MSSLNRQRYVSSNLAHPPQPPLILGGASQLAKAIHVLQIREA